MGLLCRRIHLRLLDPGLLNGCKQAREIELHEAYAKLTAGAMERGKLRSELINTEVSARGCNACGSAPQGCSCVVCQYPVDLVSQSQSCIQLLWCHYKRPFPC